MDELIGNVVKVNNIHRNMNFKCGLYSLDKYFEKKAIKETKNGTAITKVVIGDKGSIIGYYTLVSSAIVEESNKNIIYSPAIELKMFAINEKFRKKKYPDPRFQNVKYSEIVLWKAIENVEEIRKEHIGAKYMVLYSVKHAVTLYEDNGFEKFGVFMSKNQDEFVDGCVPMYLIF